VNETPQKVAVRRFYDELWNRHDLTRLGEILNKDLSFRGSLGPELRGHAAFAAYADGIHAALADYRCEIVDLIEEGAKVVARMRFGGVHRGPLLGFAATHRRVEWAGSAHFTFQDGRIADLWVLGDLRALTEQLGGT
jgi:steroid delta-isomerase-like uncharacterized protein